MEMPTDIFFSQAFELFNQFGGMPWSLKIAAIIMLAIASMKVSFLRPYWDRLGKFKPIAAPLLGLIAGMISLLAQGSFSLPGAMVYLVSGLGAVLLHELLDGVKKIPGVGKVYVAVIEFVQGLLKKPKKK